MKVVAGIQARMGSSRLPGKTLMDLAGKPLIQRVVDRARAARRVDEVFVLTTVDPSDDPLVARLEEHDVPVRRGPVDDVLARYLALVEEREPDYVVRITGDCPLIEPSFIDRQCAALAAADADFSWIDRRGSEALEGTLGGQSVLSARALRSARAATEPRDREHVASFFFQLHDENYRWAPVKVDDIYYQEGIRLTVDEGEDLALARAIFARFAPVHDSLVPLPEVLRWLVAHPEVSALNRHVEESADNRAQRAVRRAAELRRTGREG